MKKLLMICSLVLVSTAANAGGFIEPYFGIQIGEATDSGGAKEDSKGTALGLRLGYQAVIPWVALDVRLNKGTIDTTPEQDYSGTDIGITAGVSVPFLRPMIGYIPAAKQKYEASGSSNELEGSAFKFGLGIKILPLIDINIDRTAYKFTKINGNDLNNDVKHDVTTIGLGIVF